MSQGIILHGENDTGEPPLKHWHVSLVHTRTVKKENGEEAIEIRHCGVMVQSEDEGGAEWLAKRLVEADSQLPEGFQFNSAIAVELKPPE